MMASAFLRSSFQRLGKASVGIGCTAGTVMLFQPKIIAKEETLPAFSLTGNKYDQSTYIGRLKSTLENVDPRTLLIGADEVKKAQQLLDEFAKTGQVPAGKTNEDMWNAKTTVDAVIHPVTKEEMFWGGRMSAFVPMNAPIVFLMLNTASTPGVILGQWLNQSYNVMNNYTNRSSKEVEWAELLKPYAIAVTVSCSIALGARKAVSKFPTLAKLGIFIPYFAVISAGSCNVAFTRMDEWNGRGVCIFSPEGKELGMSVKAGQQAVFKTVSTRSCVLPMPLLLAPPLVMKAVPFTGPVATGIEMFVILCCLSIALPCTLAILPQEMELSTDSLEPEYQNLKDSKGEPITKVFANKGL
eukprot:TRINITY_DN14950_c0_g1_i1.p1 TRINITY_DN14950_c0_g1~~TRINITY_DN14950_c0_g1_i1.p1  ORF type:complete len:356 (+),score=60.81 TRINITY_DN14950_c0_g1_i1:44-1111(+)